MIFRIIFAMISALVRSCTADDGKDYGKDEGGRECRVARVGCRTEWVVGECGERRKRNGEVKVSGADRAKSLMSHWVRDNRFHISLSAGILGSELGC